MPGLSSEEYPLVGFLYLFFSYGVLAVKECIIEDSSQICTMFRVEVYFLKTSSFGYLVG